jgi:signal transduction histidine kinase
LKKPPRSRHETRVRDAVAEQRRAEWFSGIGLLAERVAGELRQPLTVIRNSVYYLNVHSGEDLDEKRRRHLSILLDETENITSVLANLAALTSTRVPERQDVDVEVVVAAAMDHVRRRFQTEIRTVIQPAAMVYCDPDQLRLALVNVVANSVQAAAQRVDIVCRPADREMVFEITDNGRGMDREVLRRAFELLYTTSPHRIGIGLTVVRRLLGVSGGTVDITSVPGKGTKVTFRLPGRAAPRPDVPGAGVGRTPRR